MAQWLKIGEDELDLGRPLAWPIYDKDGTLLLSAGQKIGSAMVKEHLLERGAYRLPNEQERARYQQERDRACYPAGTNPFQLFPEYSTRLKNVFCAIKEYKPDAEVRLLKLARDIQKFCLFDVNAALATLHLPLEGCYTLRHPLHCAIIAELIAQNLKLTHDEREILCAANLVANLAMQELQKILNEQDEPVTELQYRQIQQHPQQSAEQLHASGIRNPLLLEMVLQHHERIDGTGYPFSLKAEEIIQGARVMGVADTYAAMVSKRAHSKPMVIKAVLRELFLQRNKLFDEDASLTLVKVLGVYPTGSFVKLKNGDTAIVIRQDKNSPLCPMV